MSARFAIAAVGAIATGAAIWARRQGGGSQARGVAYYGTSDPELAEAVLREGAHRARRQKSAAMAPKLEGHIYLTRDLQEATRRAAGGVVLQVQPEGCVPDESWLGRMALHQLARRAEWPVYRQRSTLEQLDLVSQALRLVPEVTKARWIEPPKVTHRRDGAGVVTSSTWGSTHEERVGLQMIRLLRRSRAGRAALERLAEVAPDIACDDRRSISIGPLRAQG